MNPAANDYCASNATQNISLAEADQFRDRLAGALALEFGESIRQDHDRRRRVLNPTCVRPPARPSP